MSIVILFMSLLFLISVRFGPVQPNQLGPLRGRPSLPHIRGWAHQIRVRLSLISVYRLLSGSPPVKHPSGDGTAVLSIIEIAVRVLVCIKNYQA